MLVHVSVFSTNYGGKGTADRETPRLCTHTHITLTVQARIVWITGGVGGWGGIAVNGEEVCSSRIGGFTTLLASLHDTQLALKQE